MKILGITGGVGAGKSTVLNYLKERYQAELLIMDDIGRELETPGHDCFDKIVKAFGTGILAEDGSLDRPAVAQLVFHDADSLEKLNGIVHPAVREETERRLQALKSSGCRLAVLESALLLEESYDTYCDALWYVYADEETRIRRLMRDRGYTAEKAMAVMANQKSDEEFREKCQVVIDNSRENVQNTYGQIDREISALIG